jgi:hypothetical protein
LKYVSEEINYERTVLKHASEKEIKGQPYLNIFQKNKLWEDRIETHFRIRN